MMYTRRSPFRMLLMVGFGVLLGAMLFGGAGATSSVVAAPLLALGVLFKIALFFLFFGFVAKTFGGHGRAQDHRRRHHRSHEDWADEARQWWHRSHDVDKGQEKPHDSGKNATDKFEEWHRMAHAKEEVDTHTPPVED